MRLGTRDSIQPKCSIIRSDEARRSDRRAWGTTGAAGADSRTKPMARSSCSGACAPPGDGEEEAAPPEEAAGAAGETARRETGAPETGAPEAGAPETGAPETGAPETGAADPTAGDVRGAPPEFSCVCCAAAELV